MHSATFSIKTFIILIFYYSLAVGAIKLAYSKCKTMNIYFQIIK